MKKSYRTPPPRFLRIKKLSCFDEVKKMLLDGYSIPSIVRFIKVDKKECDDISNVQLQRLLYDFRKSLSPAEVVKTRMPKQFIKAWQELEKQIPELNHLAKLIDIQQKRVGITFNREKQMKVLMPEGHKDIAVAANLLKTAVDIKMDLGILDRNLGAITVHEDVLPALQKAAVELNVPELELVGLDPVGRRKVLDVVSLILNMTRGDKIEEMKSIVKVSDTEGKND